MPYNANQKRDSENRIRCLIDELDDMTDQEFLAYGRGDESEVCPIPRWRMAYLAESLSGAIFCAHCQDGNCASNTDCRLAEGNANTYTDDESRCYLANYCVCATPWQVRYWPTERMAAFRDWVRERLLEGAEIRERQAKQQESSSELAAGPGRATHGSFTRPSGRIIA